MTNENKKFSIPITKNETVDSTSSGKVTGPTWDPRQGLRRQEQIEAARREAAEELQRQTMERDPIYMRIAALEGVVQHLQQEVKELKANAT